MEANEFIAKLKADGSPKDQHNLCAILEEYKSISARLPAKDKGSFSLNVLCILCRNLDKVPSWTSKICLKTLVALTVDCVRETRTLEKGDRVKTLACIYHIHKHVVKKNANIPPEQILKLSYMPFDDKLLIKEYSKTYWNILVDRLTFIDSLKTKVNITKVLPKLTEDIIKVMAIYDPLQFCTTGLVFLIKKLFFIFNGKKLNETFKNIFETLSKSDVKKFKSLTDKEAKDLYVKFNECFFTVADYSSRFKFKDTVLNLIARTCIALLGHKSDIFHCVQSLYLNGFCNILTDKSESVNLVFSGLLLSCENAEKLGYKSVMDLTYPFLNQLLRLYVEFTVTENMWSENFSIATLENILEIIKFLIKKLKNTEQLLKCENCSIRTGSHDALRLSFVLKHFVSVPLKQRTDISTILPFYVEALTEQYETLNDLKAKGCSNYEKCLKKAQTDTHNTAILLNKACLFEYSVKLFDLYLKKEIEVATTEQDLKNISRGFYNKSICELDHKAYENSLKSSYLSYLFAYPDSLNTDKQMSLVIDIKAKILKSKTDSETENLDKEQLITSVDMVKDCQASMYGDLKKFFCNLKFSTILKYEFEMYCKLWPSLVPIAGVWSSLYNLMETKFDWMTGEDENTVLWTLIEVILKTASVVRTIHNEHYKSVLNKLMEKLERSQMKSTDQKMVFATLLLLQCDYDLAEASEHFGWKISNPNMDPDQANITRTLPAEHKALTKSFKAVEMCTEILPQVKKEYPTKTKNYLQDVLKILEIYVPLLLYYQHAAPGLQLAHVCTDIALLAGDKESYVRNASTILSCAQKSTQTLGTIIKVASTYVKELMNSMESLETAVIFLCESAIYSIKSGAKVSAAKLVQIAQFHLINAIEKHPENNLDLALGRLLAAECALCRDSGPSALSSVIGTQRHYLTASNSGTKWCTRTLNSYTIKHHTTNHSITSVAVCKSVQLWRRARSAAGVALGGAGGAGQGALLAEVCCTHRPTAQALIDNRLKHILGLQPSNDTQPHNHIKPKHTDLYLTPKPTQLETMLEAQFKKNDTSPTANYIEKPRFKVPEFLTHGPCTCYACHTPYAPLLACQIAGLEASMYYRSMELECAKKFYEGALDVINLTEKKLSDTKNRYLGLNFEGYVVDMVDGMLRNKFGRIKIEILIENSFFQLAEGNFSKCDENIIQIQELLSEIPKDCYLENELYNLICTSANVRKTVKKREETGLEEEMGQMRLSPAPKTPETKPKLPPKVGKIPIVLPPEELPTKNRKVIKLNLDDETPGAVKPRTRKTKIPEPKVKVPEPKVAKPAIEAMTPRPRSSRLKPKIVISQDK